MEIKTIKQLKELFESYGFDNSYISYTDHTENRKEYHVIIEMKYFPFEVHIEIAKERQKEDIEIEVETIVINRKEIASTASHPLSFEHVEAGLFLHSQLDFKSTQFITNKAA